MLKKKNDWKKINNPKVAIQIHIYYSELIGETIRILNNIPIPFDLFISTDSIPKKNLIQSKLHDIKNVKAAEILIYENKGRDVAPFITQMSNCVDCYDYVCHIHTKKSKHLKIFSSGDEWREYLFDNLLGSEEFVKSIIEIFDNNPDLGIICPHTFKPMAPWVEWGKNFKTVNLLIEKTCKTELELPDKPDFPVGNMLWLRSSAVNNLFISGIQMADFEDEMGQLDGTLAHSIERSWFYIANSNGYSSLHYNYHKQPVKYYPDYCLASLEKTAVSLIRIMTNLRKQ